MVTPHDGGDHRGGSCDRPSTTPVPALLTEAAQPDEVGTSLGGDGPLLRLATAPTTGFTLWLSRRAYRATEAAGDWIRPPEPPDDDSFPQALAVDATAEALLADVPNVELPREADFVDLDQRRICVGAGERTHWRPGEDGNPGVAAQRNVVLARTTPVAVDAVRAEPRILDHRSEPVLTHLSPAHSTRAHPGWQRSPVRTHSAAHSRFAYRDALQQVDCCLVDVGEHASSVDAAFVVACAAMKAIPVVVRNSSPAFERRLDPTLWATISELNETRLRTDAYYRDAAGVALRRHALRAHSSSQIWPTMLGQRPPSPHVTVMVSSIRPSFLGQVIDYLNAQTHRAFDAQIVFDRVAVDPVELKAQLERATFPITVRLNEDQLTVGEIYGEMMRTSDADIVVVWDDDDHYGRHHLEDLVAGLTHSGALLAGKCAEFFHLEGHDVTVQRWPGGRYTGGSLVGGSNLAMWRTQTLSFGGFKPITLGYDQELVQRVRDAKCGPYRIHGYEYVAARRASGHTWDPGDAYFLDGSVRQWPGLALDAAGFGTLDDVTTATRYR